MNKTKIVGFYILTMNLPTATSHSSPVLMFGQTLGGQAGGTSTYLLYSSYY